MKNTDLLISQNAEVKKLNEQIHNLNEKLANVNILLGSKEELIKSTEKAYQKEIELLKDSSKIVEVKAAAECEHCRYNNGPGRTTCANCGRALKEKRVYKNLKEELADIKKGLEKELKISVAALEDKQLDLEIEIERLNNVIQREKKVYNNEVGDLQTKHLNRFNKLKEQHAEELQKVTDELEKVRTRNTEEDKENKRIEEVEKLKAANVLLAEKLVVAEKTGFIRRFINKLFDLTLRKQAIKEILEAVQLTNKIENSRVYSWKSFNRGRNEYKTPWGYTPSSSSLNVSYC